MTDPFSSEQGDPFGDPAPQGNRPNMAMLYGRLVLIEPKKIETVKDNMSKDKDATIDRLTAHVDVLDGEFPMVRLDGRTGLRFDQLRPPQPQPQPLNERHFDSMWINVRGVVNACRPSVEGNGPRKVLGRVLLGEAKPGMSAPYYLQSGNEEEKQLARDYLKARAISNPQSLV